MNIKITGVDGLIKDFDKYVHFNNRATNTALNEASKIGRTKALKESKGEWVGLKAKDFKKLHKLLPAKGTNNEITFTITSKSINLALFGAKWQRKTKTGRKTKGVSYKLKTKRRTMKGSFIAKGMVFSRKTNEAGSITPHFTITPTSMFKAGRGERIFKNTTLLNFNLRYKKYLKDDFFQFAKKN
jgi:hypothetical protein